MQLQSKDYKMGKLITTLIFLVFVQMTSLCQVFNDSLRDVLISMKTEDQLHRNQIDSVRTKFGNKSTEMDSLWQVIHEVDSSNTISLIKIIETYGWPGASLVGKDGTRAAFLLLQHADRHPTAQSKYLPLVIEAAERGELDWMYVAYLIDRVKLYKQGEEQIYGTQLQLDSETGLWQPINLKDPENVDERRARVGLFPLQVYLDMYNK